MSPSRVTQAGHLLSSGVGGMAARMGVVMSVIPNRDDSHPGQSGQATGRLSCPSTPWFQCGSNLNETRATEPKKSLANCGFTTVPEDPSGIS